MVDNYGASHGATGWSPQPQGHSSGGFQQAQGQFEQSQQQYSQPQQFGQPQFEQHQSPQQFGQQQFGQQDFNSQQQQFGNASQQQFGQQQFNSHQDFGNAQPQSGQFGAPGMQSGQFGAPPQPPRPPRQAVKSSWLDWTRDIAGVALPLLALVTVWHRDFFAVDLSATVLGAVFCIVVAALGGGFQLFARFGLLPLPPATVYKIRAASQAPLLVSVIVYSVFEFVAAFSKITEAPDFFGMGAGVALSLAAIAINVQTRDYELTALGGANSRDGRLAGLIVKALGYFFVGLMVLFVLLALIGMLTSAGDIGEAPRSIDVNLAGPIIGVLMRLLIAGTLIALAILFILGSEPARLVSIGLGLAVLMSWLFDGVFGLGLSKIGVESLLSTSLVMNGVTPGAVVIIVGIGALALSPQAQQATKSIDRTGRWFQAAGLGMLVVATISALAAIACISAFIPISEYVETDGGKVAMAVIEMVLLLLIAAASAVVYLQLKGKNGQPAPNLSQQKLLMFTGGIAAGGLILLIFALIQQGDAKSGLTLVASLTAMHLFAVTALFPALVALAFWTVPELKAHFAASGQQFKLSTGQPSYGQHQGYGQQGYGGQHDGYGDPSQPGQQSEFGQQSGYGQHSNFGQQSGYDQHGPQEQHSHYGAQSSDSQHTQSGPQFGFDQQSGYGPHDSQQQPYNVGDRENDAQQAAPAQQPGYDQHGPQSGYGQESGHDQQAQHSGYGQHGPQGQQSHFGDQRSGDQQSQHGPQFGFGQQSGYNQQGQQFPYGEQPRGGQQGQQGYDQHGQQSGFDQQGRQQGQQSQYGDQSRDGQQGQHSQQSHFGEQSGQGGRTDFGQQSDPGQQSQHQQHAPRAPQGFDQQANQTSQFDSASSGFGQQPGGSERTQSLSEPRGYAQGGVEAPQPGDQPTQSAAETGARAHLDHPSHGTSATSRRENVSEPYGERESWAPSASTPSFLEQAQPERASADSDDRAEPTAQSAAAPATADERDSRASEGGAESATQEAPDLAAMARRALDPNTPADELHSMRDHRELWPYLASAQGADKELLDWLAETNDPTVMAYLRSRGHVN